MASSRRVKPIDESCYSTVTYQRFHHMPPLDIPVKYRNKFELHAYNAPVNVKPQARGAGIPGGFDILRTSFDKFPTPHLLYFILCGQQFCVKNPSHGKGYLSNPLGTPAPLPWCLTLTGA